MRFFVTTFFVLSTLTCPAMQVFAAEPAGIDDAAIAPHSDIQDGSLDSLYRQLKRARDHDQAAGLARRIDEQLDASPSATVSLLISWSDDAENEGRNAAALDFLSEAIALRPDEPAAYRKRAVLHFTHGALFRAMDDLRTALKLEPRDFSAMGLMATILERTGHDEAALDVWRRYLVFYPADREISGYVERVENEMAGKRI